MRLHRLLTGLIAWAMLGLTPVALPASTAAAEAETARQPARQAPLPKRDVSSKVVKRQGQLIFKGNVSPGHAHKPVFIQKKNCKGERCDWHRFEKVRTNGKGGFNARITAPRNGYWYWRAKVRAHGGYGTSYSDVWRSYTI